MKVIENQKLTETFYKLTIESKEIASNSSPGQFVNIRCSRTFDPLLCRPFAIHRKDKDRMTFEVLYEIVGKGTSFLSALKQGDNLEITGPLGSGFKIHPEKKIAVIVAGGAGVAPLPVLVERLLDKAVYVITGFKRQDCIVCIDDVKELSVQTIITTDDGSAGEKGFASDLLKNLLENEIKPAYHETTTIYACGPKPLLKEVAAIAAGNKIECQVSIEQKMACGIGACMGCSIETNNGYKLACKDGPVFDARELKW